MSKEHPANEGPPRLAVFLWRYFTGHHLDGRARTNATWFKRGTVPSHHANWWNSKPRAHRMLWRWSTVIIPVGWVTAYSFSPVYGINLTVIVTLCALPYLFHHGMYRIISLIPKNRVVFVSDNVRAEEVDTEIDDISIGDQIEQDPIQDMFDVAVKDATAKRERRRT